MTSIQHVFAEWVSPGHPDRLCDAIAEGVVDHALERDSRSFVAVEVAVHRDRIFLDGRVACGFPHEHESDPDRFILSDDVVRDAYARAGYGGIWSPAPASLKVERDLCLDSLEEEERAIRTISDDQSVSIGYACNQERTAYLPLAHWLARDLGRSLFAWRETAAASVLGPDLKVLPQLVIESPGTDREQLRWKRLTISWQHIEQVGYGFLYRTILPALIRRLEELELCGFPGIATNFDARFLHLNGCGGFACGGPHGDNGLSGKKLVVDCYGPSVPIGGGALCGKDPHKVDRCGPYRARQLALSLVERGAPEALVRLVWSPGDAAPAHVDVQVAETPGAWRPAAVDGLPGTNWFSIERTVRELGLDSVAWRERLYSGYFGFPARQLESAS